jgi:Leucine-rich repeat (LRR) protein
MHFLSIFLSPITIISSNKGKGLCDIEHLKYDNVSIEKICHIYNISQIIQFYKSPKISILDKLQKIEENDCNNNMGFHIKKGGLFNGFEYFEQFITTIFM